MAAAVTPTGSAGDTATVALVHALRGVRLQAVLRGILVAFAALTLVVLPPPRYAATCGLLVAAYAGWALVVAAWARRDRPAAVDLVWLALFVDLLVLTVLTLLTGIESPQSPTADVLVSGLLLVPVLAAAQLRPGVCAAVVVPTVVAYLLAGIATREADVEPWSALLLRTAIVAGVAAGCFGLSWIQRSRVRTIGALVRDRADLLAELTGIEHRERRTLSEQLHDGALQYVLAARQDLDDARDGGDPEAFARLEHALGESSRLLRSTVAELHPAVLERAGLRTAMGDLVATAAARGGFRAVLDTDRWPDDRGGATDALLHRTARELLANVVKHAHARAVTVTLERRDGWARLVVADDGVGLPGHAADALGAGHIGLASHAVRIAAAGGRLVAERGREAGTTVTAELPWRPERRSPQPDAGAASPSVASA
jgi:two-component system NarL family sensor kinase